MATIELDIREGCLALPGYASAVFSATVASRVSSVVQLYLREFDQEDQYYRIDAGIRSIWKALGGSTAPKKQVTDALVVVESLAERLDSVGDSRSLRCAHALEAIGAALHCQLTPSARFAADSSSAAFDLVYTWLEEEITSVDPGVADLERKCRSDQRFENEAAYQEVTLRTVAEIGQTPLIKSAARELQYEAEEQAMMYSHWMQRLTRTD